MTSAPPGASAKPAAATLLEPEAARKIFGAPRDIVAWGPPDPRRGRARCWAVIGLPVGFPRVALGIARSMSDALVELARDKIPRCAGRTVCNDKLIQAQDEQSEAQVGSARAFLLGAFDEIWHDIDEIRRLTIANNATIRLASTWAIHQAKEIVDTLNHAAGATAVCEGKPLERQFRDIDTVIQQYQDGHAHSERVGQVLLGLEPDRTMFTF
jgi:indole-3-acetate monooxygenase